MFECLQKTQNNNHRCVVLCLREQVGMFVADVKIRRLQLTVVLKWFVKKEKRSRKN